MDTYSKDTVKIDVATTGATGTAKRPHQGRRAVISRQDLIVAAIALTGPHRSVATLSLREVAREAGIAPNSFYRHFRDTDELAVALIDEAGSALRQVIGQARIRATSEHSVVRSSIETFMEQLHADDQFLPILLREGTVGSDAFKQAVEKQLRFFEEELCFDLTRLAQATKTGITQAPLVAKAITRLVFAIGATAMDQPKSEHPRIAEELISMVRMIVIGTQALSQNEKTTR